jgi:hypothetical protein
MPTVSAILVHILVPRDKIYHLILPRGGLRAYSLLFFHTGVLIDHGGGQNGSISCSLEGLLLSLSLD